MANGNYEPEYEPVDDHKHAQNDDNNKAEFAQFLLWRQNGRPAVKTTSKKSKKSAAARNTSKDGSKKERGRGPNAQSASVLSGSDDDLRFI